MAMFTLSIFLAVGMATGQGLMDLFAGSILFDPAARESQRAATEEHLAETMSETPNSNPERQQLDLAIRRAGDKFSGEAAHLNYLIEEYMSTTTTTTTPVPAKLPRPQSPVFEFGSLQGSKLNGKGNNNNADAPGILWATLSESSRKKKKNNNNIRKKNPQRESNGAAIFDQWAQRQIGNVNEGSIPGLNDPNVWNPTTNAPWSDRQTHIKQNIPDTPNDKYKSNRNSQKLSGNLWGYTNDKIKGRQDPWLNQANGADLSVRNLRQMQTNSEPQSTNNFNGGEFSHGQRSSQHQQMMQSLFGADGQQQQPGHSNYNNRGSSSTDSYSNTHDLHSNPWFQAAPNAITPKASNVNNLIQDFFPNNRPNNHFNQNPFERGLTSAHTTFTQSRQQMIRLLLEALLTIQNNIPNTRRFL